MIFLLATLKMLDNGVPRSRLVGSWAGATGYPQFLPSVYLRLAKDGDGDGKADIWTSEADALARVPLAIERAFADVNSGGEGGQGAQRWRAHRVSVATRRASPYSAIPGGAFRPNCPSISATLGTGWERRMAHHQGVKRSEAWSQRFGSATHRSMKVLPL